MKVAFIMPTYFAPDSVIAGGERYAYGLAKKMAEKADTALISFAPQPGRVRDGKLRIIYSRILFRAGGISNPFALDFIPLLKEFDVIHCLQYKTLVTDMAVLFGKKVFVTDLAGGTYYCFSQLLPTYKKIKSFLMISEYNRGLNPETQKVPTRIIYGGVDQNYFVPGRQPASSNRFLFIGRIFPSKGIHDLIPALTPGMELDICGTCHDHDYYAQLKTMSKGKKVSFYEGISDDDLLLKIQSAAAVVLPSLTDGGFTSAMEAMACGTPVIGTRVGSLPEVIEEGKSGLIVAPSDSAGLSAKMSYLIDNPQERSRMSRYGREKVLRDFTWDRVAERCLEAYQL